MNLIPDAISVVIPTYNRAHLIKESIQSVLDQTLQPYEIIVVDDFSTDNTEEVVNSFNSPVIKFVKNQRKKGANGARNTGILMAQGEYIAFHDSDDIWLPNKLHLQFINLKETDSDMCFCSLKKENQSILSRSIVPKKYIKSENIKESLKQFNFISTQTIFLKSLIAQEIKFDENLKRFQDWDFVLRFSKHYKISHLNQVLVIQKISGDSITKQSNYLDAYEVIYKKHSYLYRSGLNNKIVASKINLKSEFSTAELVKLIYYKLSKIMTYWN